MPPRAQSLVSEFTGTYDEWLKSGGAKRIGEMTKSHAVATGVTAGTAATLFQSLVSSMGGGLSPALAISH